MAYNLRDPANCWQLSTIFRHSSFTLATQFVSRSHKLIIRSAQLFNALLAKTCIGALVSTFVVDFTVVGAGASGLLAGPRLRLEVGAEILLYSVQ